jgi:hypothetical protein
MTRLAPPPLTATRPLRALGHGLVLAIGLCGFAHAQTGAQADWRDGLRWGDGKQVQWRATNAPACDGSNVEMRLVNATPSAGLASLANITFSCMRGAEYVGPTRTVGLVGAGASVSAPALACACAEQGGVKVLLSVDLDFKREGQGEETLANGCTYKGGYSGGKRNGQGAYACANGYKLSGTFRNDLANGPAVETLAGGQSYAGDFLNGVRQGKGKMTYANGSVYEGDFVSGLRQGVGRMRYPDGSEYLGAWASDKRSGQGTYTASDQSWTFSGAWVNDRREGPGKLTYVDGSFTYDGPFRADQMEGSGQSTFGDGRQFEGAYAAGRQIGPGVLTFTDGRKVSGEFKDHRPHGLAIDEGPAARFEGAWVDGLLEGQAKASYPNGVRFEGAFKAGKREGPGTEFFPDGATRTCPWTADVAGKPCKETRARGAAIEFRR